MATATTTTAMESIASQTFTVKEDKKGKRVSEPTAEVLALVKRAVELRKREAAAKAEQDDIKDQLKALMGEQGIDQFVHQGTVRASRSESFPRRFDSAAFEEAHPGLMETYKVPAEKPEVRLIVK